MGLIIDNFAGGGGASTGIEKALGRYIDIAINHDPAAILMHKTNHPNTKHYCENIWEIDPLEATKNQQVARCGNSVSPVLAEALVKANFN
ncbi:MAG: hypothetical protein MSH33_01055 [Fusobacterium necrophorum]|nr:hypothetical protein [Fusobacterium necrophorum]